MTTENQQTLKEDYRRVEAFLADPAVKAAIQRVADAAYAEFKGAKTPAERESAWAKGAALDAISDELTRVMDTGKLVVMKEQIAAAQEERQRAADARRTGRKR